MLPKIFKTTAKIVAAIWIVWFVFLLITLRYDGFNLDPITRSLFSAKNFWYDLYGVKVKTYIMTSEQVSKVLKDSSSTEPEYWHYCKECKREQLYYVLRIRGSSLLGQLLCKFPTGEKNKYKIYLEYSGPIHSIIVPCSPKIYDIAEKAMNTRWNFYKKSLRTSTRWTNLIFCK